MYLLFHSYCIFSFSAQKLLSLWKFQSSENCGRNTYLGTVFTAWNYSKLLELCQWSRATVNLVFVSVAQSGIWAEPCRCYWLHHLAQWQRGLMAEAKYDRWCLVAQPSTLMITNQTAELTYVSYLYIEPDDPACVLGWVRQNIDVLIN